MNFKDPIHLKVTAILLLFRGATTGLIALFMAVIFSFVTELIATEIQNEDAPMAVIHFIEGIFYVVRVLFFVFAGFNILGGILIWNGNEAGRIIGIIMSIIALWNVPIGTAIGGYSLLVLLDNKDLSIIKEK